MADPFVAEIRVFPFTFPPKGWAFCNGQILPISQNTALFALLGTTYGGDGKSTFALPDLQGSAAVHPDGQTQFSNLGAQGGSQSVALLASEMPAHTHTVQASNFPGDVANASPAVALARSTGGNAYQTTATSNFTQMNPGAVSASGGGLPHNNMQPFLTLNFNIALQGVFPPRP